MTLPLISDSFFLPGVHLCPLHHRHQRRDLPDIRAFPADHAQDHDGGGPGQYSVACAYATLMMFIVYFAIALMNIVVNRMRRSRRVKEQKVSL